MKKHILKGILRTLSGRKVRGLRRDGFVPGTIYGKHIPSASLSVGIAEFSRVWEQARESGLIDLTLDGHVRPVLIHNVQKDAVKGTPLHVEFFQVNLKEKVRTKVPVELVGESAAVTGKIGTILTVLDELEVESLPTDLPENISLDVSMLSQVGQEVKVSAITAPAGVTIMTEPGLTVVKVAPLVSKEAQEQAAAEAAAAAEATAQSQPEAVPQEGGQAPSAAPAPTPAPQPHAEEK